MTGSKEFQLKLVKSWQSNQAIFQNDTGHHDNVSISIDCYVRKVIVD